MLSKNGDHFAYILLEAATSINSKWETTARYISTTISAQNKSLVIISCIHIQLLSRGKHVSTTMKQHLNLSHIINSILQCLLYSYHILYTLYH